METNKSKEAVWRVLGVLAFGTIGSPLILVGFYAFDKGWNALLVPSVRTDAIVASVFGFSLAISFIVYSFFAGRPKPNKADLNTVNTNHSEPRYNILRYALYVILNIFIIFVSVVIGCITFLSILIGIFGLPII